MLALVRQGFEKAVSVPYQLSLRALDHWTTLEYEARGEKRAPSKWASNVVSGFGLGAGYAIYGLGHGIGGVIYEPYKGARKNGVKGGLVGVAKGLGGLVYRPLKGVGYLLA